MLPESPGASVARMWLAAGGVRGWEAQAATSIASRSGRSRFLTVGIFRSDFLKDLRFYAKRVGVWVRFVEVSRFPEKCG